MPAAYDDPTFLHETWSLFAVGAAVLLLRLGVRMRTVGIREFAGDDYISALVLLCYVGDAITVDMTYHYGTNVDFTQDQMLAMTDRERQEVVTGTKMQLLAWYSYTGLIWALKACMLFFFTRLTSGLSMQTYVRWLSVAIVLSYVAIFLTISCGCFPIQRNWQLTPDPGISCTFRPQNLYVCSVLNVITDTAILVTPIPMLWNLNVSRARKLGLSLLLFPGVFVIAAALIRAIMSLEASPSALNLNRWGVRETLAGIIAVNIPILRPMLRRAFWSRGPMLLSHKKSSHNKSTFGDGGSSQPRTWASSAAPFKRVQSSSSVDPERQGDAGSHTKDGVAIEMTDNLSNYSNRSRGSAANSQEFIIQRPLAANHGKDGVLVETSFQSSVEYHQKEPTPEMPWDHTDDKSKQVRSTVRAGE